MGKLVFNSVSRKTAEGNGGGIIFMAKVTVFCRRKSIWSLVSNIKTLNCQQVNKIPGLIREH